MHTTIPAAARILLDFIGLKEAPRGYGTVFGNNQGKLPKPLTQMTFDEVVKQGPWRTREFGSSACGRYQFMRDTLDAPKTNADLKGELGLSGDELFDERLQDRMGLHLLRRRGYDRFMAGTMSATTFGNNLAKEWASFPVLSAVKGAHRRVKRGETFYLGDGLNKVLASPEEVEAVLARAKAAGGAAEPARTISPVPIASDTPVMPFTPPSAGELLSGLAGWIPGLKPKALPAPALPPGADPVVWKAQGQLVALGYTEVGLVDGKAGDKFRSAVRAFRAENGLPDGDKLDDALLAALIKAQPRPVAPERATATADTLRREGNPTVKAFDGAGLVAKILFGGGILGGIDQTGALSSVKQTADQALSTLQTVQQLVTGILSAVQWCFHHWWVFAIGAALYLAFKVASGKLDLVWKFRRGILQQAGR